MTRCATDNCGTVYQSQEFYKCRLGETEETDEVFEWYKEEEDCTECREPMSYQVVC